MSEENVYFKLISIILILGFLFGIVSIVSGSSPDYEMKGEEYEVDFDRDGSLDVLDGYYVISDLNKTSQNKVEANVDIKVTGFDSSDEEKNRTSIRGIGDGLPNERIQAVAVSNSVNILDVKLKKVKYHTNGIKEVSFEFNNSKVNKVYNSDIKRVYVRIENY